MLSSAVLRFRTSISPGRGESLLQKAAAGELGQVGRKLVTITAHTLSVIQLATPSTAKAFGLAEKHKAISL